MTERITQSQVNQTAGAACDTFRGVVDAGQYKDYKSDLRSEARRNRQFLPSGKPARNRRERLLPKF